MASASRRSSPRRRPSPLPSARRADARCADPDSPAGHRRRPHEQRVSAGDGVRPAHEPCRRAGAARGAPGRAADPGRHRRHGRAELPPQAPGDAAGSQPHRRTAGMVDRRRWTSAPGRRCHVCPRDRGAGRSPSSARDRFRTVGSHQIRNTGTVGGNLGAASPAGDAHPPLLAARAHVEVASPAGTRYVPIDEFFIGPKRAQVAPDELIAAVHVAPASGPQQFSKVGTRNAMVIAVCSFSLAIDRDARRVGTGIGSAGPTPLRAAEAERFLETVLDECAMGAARCGRRRNLPTLRSTRLYGRRADRRRPRHGRPASRDRRAGPSRVAVVGARQRDQRGN